MKDNIEFIVVLCTAVFAIISVFAFTLKYVVFPLFGA